jgi:hypothetical protein
MYEGLHFKTRHVFKTRRFFLFSCKKVSQKFKAMTGAYHPSKHSKKNQLKRSLKAWGRFNNIAFTMGDRHHCVFLPIEIPSGNFKAN